MEEGAGGEGKRSRRREKRREWVEEDLWRDDNLCTHWVWFVLSYI